MNGHEDLTTLQETITDTSEREVKESQTFNTAKVGDYSKQSDSNPTETKAQTAENENCDSSVPNTPELSNSQMTPCSSRGGSPSPSTKDSLSEISEEDSASELSEASGEGSASSNDSEKVSVTDGSDSSDDDNVKSLKRLHRDGTKRLVELSEEFEALKARLMESKIEDLDNEKKEILNGEHPEYREQQAQLDERLSKRRKIAETRKQYRRFDIQNQFDGTKKQALDTLMAEKAVLRQSFMDLIQRKRRLLQKEFDALEEQKVSQVYSTGIINHLPADPSPKGLENQEAQKDLSVMRISSLLNTEREAPVTQSDALSEYAQQEQSQAMFVNYVKSRNSSA